MNLDNFKSENELFIIDFENHELCFNENFINYIDFTSEMDNFIFFFGSNESDEVIYHFTNVIEFLMEIENTHKDNIKWRSNIVYHTNDDFKSYIFIYDKIINDSFLNDDSFYQIKSILHEIISLKKVITSYSAYFFENISYSKDLFPLKKGMFVYFLIESDLNFGEIIFHKPKSAIIEVASKKIFEITFDRIFVKRKSIENLT